MYTSVDHTWTRTLPDKNTLLFYYNQQETTKK